MRGHSEDIGITLKKQLVPDFVSRDGLPALLPLWMKAFIKGPRALRFTLNVYTEINSTVSQVADRWTLTARSVREIIHHRGDGDPQDLFSTRCLSFLLSEGSCEMNISTVVHVGSWPGSAAFHQL